MFYCALIVRYELVFACNVTLLGVYLSYYCYMVFTQEADNVSVTLRHSCPITTVSDRRPGMQLFRVYAVRSSTQQLDNNLTAGIFAKPDGNIIMLLVKCLKVNVEVKCSAGEIDQAGRY